ncbi:hypothetical protein [Alkaliphilus sp. B6464]|uniref:hypothetical protein n=1 Tax=Alkaliphilus sp. B6464 TaxID=2731219 RepID=UPI001BAE3B41|nr:hypothetical protein [Alkaliphilus sp. B6464]QUH21773.1 hypothetical protein HYG84_17710 [Alkaliphilus sp. B6464]
MTKKKNKKTFLNHVKKKTENSITLDATKMLIEGEGKLGRHNTSQKAHVHLTTKDKFLNRNSKQSKKELHKLRQKFM